METRTREAELQSAGILLIAEMCLWLALMPSPDRFHTEEELFKKTTLCAPSHMPLQLGKMIRVTPENYTADITVCWVELTKAQMTALEPENSTLQTPNADGQSSGCRRNYITQSQIFSHFKYCS